MRPAPGSDPDHEEPQWLDDDHILEPVESGAPVDPQAPVVRDARGRLWRVRRRPATWTTVLWVVAAVFVLALVAAVWLGV